MGFITHNFDVRKFARNLDRKPAVSERISPSSTSGDKKNNAGVELAEYVYENLFLPIITDGIIPLARLEFGRISDKDIYDLGEALDNCDYKMLDFWHVMESFRPSPVVRKIMI